MVSVWPDGKETYDDKRWKGVKYEGTGEYKIPSFMLEYWKSQK